MNEQQSLDQESIHGCVERITYHSEETGFCVLRVKVSGHKDLVTVIGNAATIAVGEYIDGTGSWFNDKKHGLQFKTQQLMVVPPATLDGIERYLASGMIKGIGAHFAKKMIETFGSDIFDVIENTPEKIMQVEGMGKKRMDMIIEGWKEQQAVRHIMLFLQSNGINTSRAVRIYKTYGNEAINKVRENPYRLSHDIHGIGFKTADALAQKLGLAADSMVRAQAGIKHYLQTLCNNGHCAANYQQLLTGSAEMLEISEEIVKQAIANEIENQNLLLENIQDEWCIFPRSLHEAETIVAKHLLRIAAYPLQYKSIDLDRWLPWAESKTQLTLSESQKQAVTTVLQNKLSIITGGPGVGKTTIVHTILKILQAQGLSVALCAPTGRAAKRLTETTGLNAKTIHRLLEFDPQTRLFKHNEENPLPNDVLIVDESSMIDIMLMHYLLKALPDHASVIFVGDVDQLPSVGPGAVLADMIRSNTIPTVKLVEIFRQAKDSSIIENAHRINQGQLPLPNTAQPSDFYTIYVNQPAEIHDQLISLIAERLPQYMKCDPLRDIQILTPMNRGGLGTAALNISLQKVLNGAGEPKITRFGMTFACGDKVIQTVNNYEKEVFNGDIGVIVDVDLQDNVAKILFDQRVVEYTFTELDEINLAYAISIHKSQGSEFPIVIIPLSTQHYPLLVRNLLYTAVTRGKQLIVLVGQKKAVSIAVNNNEENNRLTRLAERLNET